MSAYNEVFVVPIGQTHFIQPTNKDWKVTAFAVKGSSFHLYFAKRDSKKNLIRTGNILTDESNLLTEIYLTTNSYIVFDNQSSSHVNGFLSAVDHP